MAFALGIKANAGEWGEMAVKKYMQILYMTLK
jgi:hypothetical protein